jgi:hypothetical protein
MGISASKPNDNSSSRADLLGSSTKKAGNSNSGNSPGAHPHSSNGNGKIANANANSGANGKPPQGSNTGGKKDNANSSSKSDPFCKIDPSTIQQIAEELNRSIVVRAPNAAKSSNAPSNAPRAANASANGNGNGSGSGSNNANGARRNAEGRPLNSGGMAGGAKIIHKKKSKKNKPRSAKVRTANKKKAGSARRR